MKRERCATARYILSGHCYHTVSTTRNRAPIFAANDKAEILFNSVRFVRTADRAYVLAFAILPDHLHLLLVPRGLHTVSSVMHDIKSYSAKGINKLQGSTGRIWQQGFYDRVIRNDEHLNATIMYIHRNPVVAGLAARESDYLWSSAHSNAGTDLDQFLLDDETIGA